MSRFIETIKLYDGKLYHLDWHQKRVDKTFNRFFPDATPIDLRYYLQDIYPNDLGLFKVRMVYNDLGYELSISPYLRKEIRTISFQEINFDYSFKFEDRDDINNIVSNSDCDEVIFTQNKNILDSSYANLAFYDGDTWWTPNAYLLNGTTRQRLIAEKKLFEKVITVDSISSFKKISFINALNDLGENTLDVSDDISFSELFD